MIAKPCELEAGEIRYSLGTHYVDQLIFVIPYNPKNARSFHNNIQLVLRLNGRRVGVKAVNVRGAIPVSRLD